jgi:hypothetical protein
VRGSCSGHHSGQTLARVLYRGKLYSMGASWGRTAKRHHGWVCMRLHADIHMGPMCRFLTAGLMRLPLPPSTDGLLKRSAAWHPDMVMHVSACLKVPYISADADVPGPHAASGRRHRRERHGVLLGSGSKRGGVSRLAVAHTHIGPLSRSAAA